LLLEVLVISSLMIWMPTYVLPARKKSEHNSMHLSGELIFVSNTRMCGKQCGEMHIPPRKTGTAYCTVLAEGALQGSQAALCIPVAQRTSKPWTLADLQASKSFRTHSCSDC
jgi:hypothetical protein